MGTPANPVTQVRFAQWNPDAPLASDDDLNEFTDAYWGDNDDSSESDFHEGD
jgi:hypothetical protein